MWFLRYYGIVVKRRMLGFKGNVVKNFVKTPVFVLAID